MNTGDLRFFAKLAAQVAMSALMADLPRFLPRVGQIFARRRVFIPKPAMIASLVLWRIKSASIVLNLFQASQCALAKRMWHATQANHQ
jgi:hypothetical protein